MTTHTSDISGEKKINKFPSQLFGSLFALTLYDDNKLCLFQFRTVALINCSLINSPKRFVLRPRRRRKNCREKKNNLRLSKSMLERSTLSHKRKIVEWKMHSTQHRTSSEGKAKHERAMLVRMCREHHRTQRFTIPFTLLCA